MDCTVGEFRTLEESLLRPEVRQSQAQLDSLIADDFLEFGASGRVFGKRDVLEAADHLPDVVLPLEDFSVKMLSPSAALVTYRSSTREPGGMLQTALRSSLWIHSDARWRLTFHQGTVTSARDELMGAR